MRSATTTNALIVACAVLFLAACDDASPIGIPDADAARPGSPNIVPTTGNATLLAVDPFTVRAPLDPYFINQAPDFMIRSSVRTDLVIQRLVTAPGVGAWHTHPGPSFAIVEQGQVMITRYTKDGCTTTVYGPGEAYFEVAGQVHRASVLGAENAVEHKVRFNTPVGAAFSTPATDPGC